VAQVREFFPLLRISVSVGALPNGQKPGHRGRSSTDGKAFASGLHPIGVGFSSKFTLGCDRLERASSEQDQKGSEQSVSTAASSGEAPPHDALKEGLDAREAQEAREALAEALAKADDCPAPAGPPQEPNPAELCLFGSGKRIPIPVKPP